MTRGARTPRIRRTKDRTSERGFTLAALIVILTILAFVVAYTAPQMWSDVLRRERDYETIWVMKQYARAIAEFERKHNVAPTWTQLKEQLDPRVLRREYRNPLSGEMDWLAIPATPPNQQAPAEGLPKVALKDYPGALAGVRPPQTGKSFVSFNQRTTYETWSYTAQQAKQEALARVGGGGTAPRGNP